MTRKNIIIEKVADPGDYFVKSEVKYINYKGYMGNPLLKRAGVDIEWTPETVSEYAKCAKDHKYFIETYIKIVHVDEGLIPFQLRDYQKQIVDGIHDNRRVIMVLPRQSGKSTAVIGYILWYILFHNHVNAALLANKAPTAREILSKLQLAYIHLPKFLQQGIIEWNKGSIVLENGSRAFADATSSDAIRGYTINLLVLDEAAHVEGWEAFATSVLPTISSGVTTKIVQISTPNGLNHFYKTWMDAQPNAKISNGYHPIMVHWRQVPGRDDKWAAEMLKTLNNDTDKFAQEFECQFMGSSGTLIAGWKLKELVHIQPITQKDNMYKYFEKQVGHTYAIVVDVSEGKGFDYSTFHVIDVTAMPYQQCVSFRSNLIGPAEFAQTIYNSARIYNNAYILIEYESLGPQISDTLYNDYGYENLIFTESAGARGKRVSTRGAVNVDKGIKMTINVKSTGCSILKLLIEQNQLIINDWDTIQELATFSRKGKSFEAEEGCHDDMVMPLVCFAWLSDQEYFREMTDINTLAQLREKNTEAIEQELVPFGFFPEPEVVAISNEEEVDKWWVNLDPDDPDYPRRF